ncbi:MAG TPA: FKBP-type peptidylprolyl isomerase, partial [Ornithinibacter sp.]|nr:FKBP-type peptidylprolyl isomerase [Ornithinibacter sp.]
MSRRVTTTLSAAALACALVLSGCGEESAPSANTSAALSAITVEGTDAKTAPTVKVDAPVTVTKTESKVLTEGTGEAITKDDLVSIQAIILNGTDGKQAHSTWETG